MEQLLKVENLRVSYHSYAGEVQSVRGVSFEVNKGVSFLISIYCMICFVCVMCVFVI